MGAGDREVHVENIDVTTTATGRDGWMDQPRRQIRFLTLNKTSARWRVASVRTTSGPRAFLRVTAVIRTGGDESG